MNDPAREWLDAVERPDVRAALEKIYAQTAERIAARGPACWASGRCCNFEKAGHLLYVTGLEAAYAVYTHLTPLTHEAIHDARTHGGCPFQQANLCGAHQIKPLGCRVYFCDRTAQEWQQALSEEMLGRIRDMHDRFSIEYRYGEWRSMLELVVAARA